MTIINYIIYAAEANAAEMTDPGILGLITTFLPILLIFGVMYLIMIRPQRKKEKALREQLSQLKVGDHVVTIGGIVGKVASIKDDTITVESGHEKENVKIRVQRWAIKSVNE